MELEVIEGSCDAELQPKIAGDVQPTGCSEGGFMIGCCIIHYWCWEPGHGLCC
jgi:hypothetical protein